MSSVQCIQVVTNWHRCIRNKSLMSLPLVLGGGETFKTGSPSDLKPLGERDGEMSDEERTPGKEMRKQNRSMHAAG